LLEQTIILSSNKIAGRLQDFSIIWEKLLGQDWATSLVKESYTPEWTSPPPLKVIQVSSQIYRQDELHTYNTKIKSLLKSGAIEEMDLNTPCFVSRFFLIPKKNGKIRPIIDLRRLNQFVKYYHFKMEGIELVKSLV
jgi:hypothetical protein